MLSKYFIDRPIFATVLSVIITLTGVLALCVLPIAQYPRITPPSVQVSIRYPGASAQVVADTVAAPIEQEVNGVPGMLYMSSQMSNDGSYMLSVTFDVDVDLNTALVMVQNRVTYAMPRLPTPVQNQGITIRKKTPDMLNMINFVSAVDVTTLDGTVRRGVISKDNGSEITLKASDGTGRRIQWSDIAEVGKPIYDDVFLSNYVLINIKDEILRVDGVADVKIMGERDYSIRAWLDPHKLAARNMTAGDVAAAIRNQNIPAAAGQVGSPPMRSGAAASQLPIDTLGRLSDPEQFGNIVIKVGPTLPMVLTKAVKGRPADSAMADGSMMTPTAIPSLVPGGTNVGGANVAGGGTTGGGADSGGGADLNVPIGFTIQPRSRKAAAERPLVSTVTMTQAPTPPAVSLVRLKDVARVEMGAINYNVSCTFDGGPAVGLSVYQLPGTNALDVADRVRAKMKKLKRAFPDGLDYMIAYDTTPFIRESIAEVFTTLLHAVLLVAIVVLFFLQDWRAMILPMIDVPVSLIGTFAVMAVMGYSLNNISLFGLVLAIGIVVDDAIVVLENIERQMAKGYDTRTATIRAMEEITGPILAITLVLCAVFIPCAFISGITGRFFRQFALTIAASTVISAINALTMTPSRALFVFKQRPSLSASEGAFGGAQARAMRKEALPWWIFGLLGFVTMSWGPYLVALATGPGDEGSRMDEIEADSSFILHSSSLMLKAIYFAPGLTVGLALGWFFIEPVNFVLGAFFRGFNRFFDSLTAMYGWTIGKALRLSVIVLLAYGGLVVVTYFAFRDSPRGFVPQQDMGRIMVSIQLPDSAGLARTQEQLAEVDQVIREVPGVAHTIGLGGISFVESAAGSNFGSFFVILEPFHKRQAPELRANAIMKKLREEFAARIKDARVVVAPSSPVPGISTSGGFKLMVQDRSGLGLPTLQDQTDKFIRKVKQQIGEEAGIITNRERKRLDAADEDADDQPQRQMLTNVNTQFRSNTPQLYMDIDRTKVASLELSLDDVNQTLQIYLGSLNVNRFNEYGRFWQVTLQADRQFRARMEDINQLQVRNKNGQMVPLGTVVTVTEKPGPIFVRRYNLHTAAPIGGALVPGVSSGEVIKAVDEISLDALPRSMKAEWTELMFLQIREGSTTAIVFLLAVVFVFLALAALYESWTLPLAVILVVPLSMLCSIFGVLLRKNVLGQDASVDIFVQIGFVVLIGLACKNSILIVEFAKKLHEEGRTVTEATLEASTLRLRPILMTSFAFILGVLPLCFASGAGAEMRRSLGTAVFSGMLGVTLFGIFMTPVFFQVIQGVGETRLFTGVAVQWAISCLVGAVLGGVIAYFLARLGVIRGMPRLYLVTLGCCIGVLAVAAVRGAHFRLSSRSP